MSIDPVIEAAIEAKGLAKTRPGGGWSPPVDLFLDAADSRCCAVGRGAGRARCCRSWPDGRRRRAVTSTVRRAPTRARGRARRSCRRSLGLIPELTVRENVEARCVSPAAGSTGAGRCGCARRPVPGPVDRGVRPIGSPAELSVGQRQRVAIARALACPAAIADPRRRADEPPGRRPCRSGCGGARRCGGRRRSGPDRHPRRTCHRRRRRRDRPRPSVRRSEAG